MKIVDKVNRFTSNVEDFTNFSIKANAKSFQILSSGLYENKIRAIIRELSTNAVDGHIKQGNYGQKTFDVYLPDLLNNNFIIRDYGCGLSPEDVQTIYTVYFASDKTNSNDFTGCLGLGSKSPFSYTSSFTVESFYHGKKYTYLLSINENGIPVCSKPIIGDTKEENGVKITIPTKPLDNNTWFKEANYVYKWFRVKPNLVRGKLSLSEDKPILFGNDWQILTYDTYSYHMSYIWMSDIIYPINKDIIKDSILQYELIIKCNIGDVEIDASREGLSYTKKTQLWINNKIKQIRQELTDNLNLKISKCKNLFDATKLYCELNSIYRNICGGQNITYLGKPIQNNVTLPTDIIYKTIYPNKIDKYNNTQFVYSNTLSINQFFINDCPKGGYQRVKHYLQNNNYAKTIVFSGIDNTNVPVQSTIISKQDIIKTIGCDESNIEFTSKLDKPPSAKRATIKSAKISELIPGYHSFCSQSRKDVSVDLKNTNGVYLPFFRQEVSFNNKNFNTKDIARMIHILKQSGYVIPTIYLIRTALVKNIPSNWKLYDSKDLIDYLTKLKIKLTKFNNHIDDDLRQILTRLNGCSEPLFKEVISLCKNKTTSLNDSEYLMKNIFYNEFNQINVTVKSVDEILKEIYQKYPLLISDYDRYKNISYLSDMEKYIQFKQ